MAVDTNRYRNRAADADKRLVFQMQSAGDLSAGVAAIDDEMRRRREEAEKRKRQETQDTLAVNERTYQRGREATQDARQASMDAERSADRAAITDERRARQKRLDDDAAREATEAKRKAVIDEAAGVQGARGIRRAELEAFGAKAGMGPDELLAELDKINQAALGDSRKVMLDDARRNKEDALAKKAGRAPAGPKPMSEAQRRIEAARVRKIEAEAKSAERDANGAGGRAPPASVTGGAQAATRKAKVQGLAADLDMLEDAVKTVEASGMDPGKVSGRARSLLSGVIDDEDQTAFEASAAAVNSQIFGLLRTDAPSESETKVIQALQFRPSDSPAQIRAKLRTVRSIIAARSNDEAAPLDVLHNRVKGGAKAAPTGDDEIDSLPDA